MKNFCNKKIKNLKKKYNTEKNNTFMFKKQLKKCFSNGIKKKI